LRTASVAAIRAALRAEFVVSAGFCLVLCGAAANALTPNNSPRRHGEHGEHGDGAEKG
jgi:hypothetical protein